MSRWICGKFGFSVLSIHNSRFTIHNYAGAESFAIQTLQFVGYVCKFKLHPLANFHDTFVCRHCLTLHYLKGDFQEGISLLNGTLFRSFSEDADSIAAANTADRKRTGDIRCKQLKLNVLGQSPFESFGQVQPSR